MDLNVIKMLIVVAFFSLFGIDNYSISLPDDVDETLIESVVIENEIIELDEIQLIDTFLIEPKDGCGLVCGVPDQYFLNLEHTRTYSIYLGC